MVTWVIFRERSNMIYWYGVLVCFFRLHLVSSHIAFSGACAKKIRKKACNDLREMQRKEIGGCLQILWRLYPILLITIVDRIVPVVHLCVFETIKLSFVRWFAMWDQATLDRKSTAVNYSYRFCGPVRCLKEDFLFFPNISSQAHKQCQNLAPINSNLQGN